MKINVHGFRAIALATSSVLTLGLASPALAQMGFSISVDGTHVAGDPAPADPKRQVDTALDRMDIQVTFDGLDAAPSLNVLPVERQSVYRVGEAVNFMIDTNYAAWIDRAEVRIHDAQSDALLAVLPGQPGREIGWSVPGGGVGEFYFVGRVYDRDGRYDQTKPLPLHRSEVAAAVGEVLPVWGDDRTAVRNISIYGGTVTVHGTSLPPDGRAVFLGESVPVDATGAFVIKRILPPGDHSLSIAVDAPSGQAVVFNRDINIPTDEWFYVGMADLTVGKRWSDGDIVAAKPGEFDSLYAKGRAAFYLKGKIKGEYLLTASGDTGEGPLDQMFTGILSTDPQAVLRRIDPDQYYPVYGDDSALVDDAPTRGKLYVRLERGPNSVMWGNFRTVVGNSDLLRTERVLYGAAAQVESEKVTPNGAPVYQASLYAAQPGTLPARDVLRGTGGSAYVLRRQDIVPGSETITIEHRDAVTGLVISTTRLRPGVDYSINYMQGVVILARPLSSSQRSDSAVQSSSNDVVNVVAQYEFSPPNAELDEFAYGGSGTVRLGDIVTFGAVGMREKTEDDQDLRVYGANVRVAPTEQTYLEAELLRSEGTAASSWLSTDGGLTYVQQPAATPAAGAYAYRIHGQAALDDLLQDTFKAVAGFTLEGRQAGFSTGDLQAQHDTLVFNGFVDAEITPDLAIALDFDHISNATGARRDELAAEVVYTLQQDLTVSLGLLHRNGFAPGGPPGTSGHRTDFGTRIAYSPNDDLTVYGFGQATLMHSLGYGRNDRVGAGADVKLGTDWTLYGEASVGSTGPQAVAGLSYEAEPGKRSYLGIRVLSETRDDFFMQKRSVSGLILGTEQRINEALSVHAENSYGLFSDAGTTTALYGVNFKPDALWTGSATYETGHIADDFGSDFERHAISVGLGYQDDGVDWSSRGELRLEDSADGSRDRVTALLQSGVSVQTSDDWRVLAGVDGLFSRSDQNAILDGDYVEATIGAAYRPVNHDRLNAIFRYTYLYDLPGPDQVSRGGSVLGPAQRSHILSVDANYDLTPTLTVGAKYGLRIGEVSRSRAVEDFAASTVHLGVIRADLEVLEDWSVMLEARALYQQETATTDLGALAAVSYDISDEVTLGVGYNFGRFTDDLSDLTFDDQGVFLNMTAKF
ncbi:MAG TPA: TonB-dependent receptor [Devosia sp.]|jgi:hypothetical protein|uniref:TonB-dependent receptor n=1 Tax=Devosia sp. TaxID=1871048 RepID=UPI002F93F0AB